MHSQRKVIRKMPCEIPMVDLPSVCCLGAAIIYAQALGISLNGWTAAADKGHHKEDQKDNEQDLGDFCRQARDAHESQHPGDNGNN